MTHPQTKTTPSTADCRADFPALHQDVNGHPLVYLDNAASSQRPQRVIDRVSNYYQSEHANVHLSLIHISEPTRRTPISYAVFCLKH